MNQKAKDLIKRQAAQIEQIGDALHMLIDNPDDSGLEADDEQEITTAINHITLAAQALQELNA